MQKLCWHANRQLGDLLLLVWLWVMSVVHPVQAYLKGDMEVLQQHCSPECLERMAGIIQAEQIAEACSCVTPDMFTESQQEQPKQERSCRPIHLLWALWQPSQVPVYYDEQCSRNVC